jgi:UDP-GlcNAc:undecaprenyl-phosphate GlcNAc-1-phosphate transferase
VAFVVIRLSQGKSPFVGDLQHLSHRLLQHGLTRAAAVYVIWGLTAVTGVSGVLLASSRPWQAALIGVQVVVMLLVIGLFEYASTKGRSA